METFEKSVREIFNLIAEYGITNKRLDFTNPSAITEKDKNEFFIQVHKGFRLGQARIIDEIIPLLRKLEGHTADEKLAKKDKNNERSSKSLLLIFLTQTNNCSIDFECSSYVIKTFSVLTTRLDIL